MLEELDEGEGIDSSFDSKEVKIVYATKGAKLYEVFDGIPSRCS
jgi:hypothetical protein